jgi:CBS-domain-containing membrane protein
MRRSTVADVMTRDVVSVRAGTPTADVALLLHDHRIRAVPVLDAEGRLLGVVSEADLMVTLERGDPRPPHWWRARHIGRRGPSAAKAGATTAGALMSAPVITAAPADGLAATARTLREHHLSWLPVVDGTGRVVGVLGRSDLIRAFLRPDEDLQREVVEMLARVFALDPQRLDVGVHGGVVGLRGRLDTHADAALAVDLAARVEGAVTVEDGLSWDVDERVGATRIGPFY